MHIKGKMSRDIDEYFFPPSGRVIVFASEIPVYINSGLQDVLRRMLNYASENCLSFTCIMKKS